MTDAAKEFTVDGFNKRFIEIQKLNPGCAAYLVDIGNNLGSSYSIWTFHIYSKCQCTVLIGKRQDLSIGPAHISKAVVITLWTPTLRSRGMLSLKRREKTL